MKSIALKLISLLALAAVTIPAMAQRLTYGPEWGENQTMEERGKNAAMYNYFKDAYDRKEYDLALSYLPQLIANVPKAMVSTYVYGGNIYKLKIQQSKSLADRGKYLDSLMYMYDMRIEYFPNHERYNKAFTLRQKATDYLLFKPSDREGLREVFDEALAENADNVNKDVLDLVNLYFKELTDDYMQDALLPEEYLAYYDSLSDYIDSSSDPYTETARTTFDALFIQSKAGDCDTIESIFRERLAASPDSADLLKKAFNQLNALACKSPFFFEVGEKYFAVEPTANAAMALAKAYDENSEAAKAMSYRERAMELEEDPIIKAEICVSMAGTELERRSGAKAAEYARTAIRYNPQNGYAYMFLAQAYVIGASSCDGFDKQSVYWLAYDEVQKARRIFAGDPANLKRADDMMGIYRGSFPNKEDLFFRGLSEGNSYNVRCGWVSGTAIVRERP